MANLLHEKHTTDFDAIRLSIASPERILDWSHGEVLKPETINYRTQKPEKDGLFCERIFGPTKDWECYCGKYKGMHYRGVECDRCGVLVARSIVRRERMGHIALAVPVTHIWFLRGTPSSVGLILNMTAKNLERIVYFANYVVISIDEDKKQALLTELEEKYETQSEAVTKKFEELSAKLEKAEADKDDSKSKKNKADSKSKETKSKDDKTQSASSSVKELAEEQSRELEAIEAEYKSSRSQLEAIVPKALMNEGEYRSLSSKYPSLFDAKIGAEAVEELLGQIDLEAIVEELRVQADETQGQKRKKILKRLKKIEGMLKAEIRPEWMIIKNVPVIPPDLRPMVQLTGGRFATSDLNDLYRRVLNRNNRLRKLIDMGAPEVIRRNEMRMLQEAVDALIDNAHARSGRAVSSTGGRRRLKSLTDMLRGKQGRFRQNLLGKRVDYSGRSVIVSGPELEIDECGLPKMMALELFKPFVIGRLMEREEAHNVKSAQRMIELGASEVWDALDEVIENKYVLLNRAPTLHRLGVQAFKPLLIEGKAIQLHPLVCRGFNADFDGDQMAVHVPLSDAAQAEARIHMAANRNLLLPSNGEIIVYIAQDMVLGAYYMTYDRYADQEPTRNFAGSDEAMYAYAKGQIELQTPIKVLWDHEVMQTTVGRILFNDILPADYPFQNQTFTDKLLQKLLNDIFNRYGEEVTAQVGNSIKNLGFNFSTVSGLSTGMDDYDIPEQKAALLKESEKRAAEINEQFQQGLINDDERARLTIDVWRKANDSIQTILEDSFVESDNSTTITVVSGARAKLAAVSQITGMLGLVQDVYGNTIELPIKSNYKEGLSPVEYFSAARGSRKGLIDTALKTADSGYLTRRMVDVAQDVFTIEDDCGDKEGHIIDRQESEEIGEELQTRLVGRFAASTIKDKKGNIIARRNDLLTAEHAADIEAAGLNEVHIRSVLRCQSLRGICRNCYGVDLARGQMVDLRVPVGVIAAQAVGEPGTQLTLRTFHKGGVAEADITHGLPRVEELMEARNPKGQAIITEVEGTVSIMRHKDDYIVRVAQEGIKIERHELGEREPLVKAGQTVSKGDALASGKGKQKELTSKLDGVVYFGDDTIDVVEEGAVMREYRLPQYRGLLVKDGEEVVAGQRLTPGSINLQELLAATDEGTVQRYIMTEIQSIFSLQGQTIADKHLEVIVRQMFSRVQIVDSGDSLFVTGDIASQALVNEENDKLKSEGKQPASYRRLLLGIAKASLASDSFLSAASFQDTTRVLISAATSGSVDDLYGLKENVIIGRKIPVGTGYHGIEVEAEAE